MRSIYWIPDQLSVTLICYYCRIQAEQGSVEGNRGSKDLVKKPSIITDPGNHRPSSHGTLILFLVCFITDSFECVSGGHDEEAGHVRFPWDARTACQVEWGLESSDCICIVLFQVSSVRVGVVLINRIQTWSRSWFKFPIYNFYCTRDGIQIWVWLRPQLAEVFC